MEINRYIGVATLLFSLSNPVGIIPIFLGLTKRFKVSGRSKVVAVAALAVACLLTAAALFGSQLLEFFDIGLDDFRIAGGLLALFIAFEMFQAHYGGIIQTSDEKTEAETDIHGVAVTPLAFPLLVGPAEMSIMITLASEAQGWNERLGLVAVAIITAAMVGLTLLLAVPINRVIGRTGINIATRVMALFVAAIGIKFIFTGIRGQLPGLIG
jgi:multiple antibiotic resistance protein